jgi:hypothetical protein
VRHPSCISEQYVSGSRREEGGWTVFDKRGLRQHSLHGGLANTQLLSQFAGMTNGCCRRRPLLSASDDASLHRGSRGVRLASPVLPLQSGHTGLLEADFPLRNGWRAGPNFRSISR